MNFDDEMLESLILEGVVEFAGLDSDGEMLYAFSPNLKETHPILHEMINAIHMSEIYTLWELGFLSMDVTRENPLVKITEKALDEEQVENLDKNLRHALLEIMDSMRKDV